MADIPDKQVGVHEVTGSPEDGVRLCAFGISTGIAVAVTGRYYKPKPATMTRARQDRFLLHASDMFLLDVDLEILEKQVQEAKEDGLIDIQAHVLAPEPYSYQAPAHRDVGHAADAGPLAPEAYVERNLFLDANADKPNEIEHRAMEDVLLGPKNPLPVLSQFLAFPGSPGTGEAPPDPAAVNEWEQHEIQHNLDVQKKLWERLFKLVRGAPVRWYKYPVCHKSDVHRWTHGMAVFGDCMVYCQSDDLNSVDGEARAIPCVEDGTEHEDSGLRCC
ncbi:hypothetical protein PG995_006541 [Apiospora arundinis]|uniref:Uncharacterized protein n=1 Tax=Apiospora arundinis TaxID=335852 RepID=A0ABR2JIZ1_9PEZI